ncbi:MAG: metal-sensitive transcriptional regulator [Dehalococcoidia bacterium]|jgi:DNA-binding FrmR family transcriptional regulator
MVDDGNAEVSREVICNRLKRIEGQIRGLDKMVAEERECEAIITQLAAVRSAIDAVGALVLNNYIKICAPRGSETDPEIYKSMVKVVGVWGRVRLGDQ